MENIVFTQLSITEIRELFREELERYFSENPFSNFGNEEGVRTIFDVEELCRYTGMSRQTIYRKTGKGLIPHSKRGKRLYFDKKEIDDWLMNNKISPQKIEEKVNQYFKTKKG